MLPIPNVITEVVGINCVSSVKRVEVHVEDIDHTGAMVVDDHHGACRLFGGSFGIWFLSVQPLRFGRDVFVRGEVDICAIAPIAVEPV